MTLDLFVSQRTKIFRYHSQKHDQIYICCILKPFHSCRISSSKLSTHSCNAVINSRPAKSTFHANHPRNVSKINQVFLKVEPAFNTPSIEPLPKFNYRYWRENFKRSKTAKSGYRSPKAIPPKMTRANPSPLHLYLER